jgi:hypothetical protein
MVPPEKSMPSGSPPRATIEPDAGQDDDRREASACQRQRMKS